MSPDENRSRTMRLIWWSGFCGAFVPFFLAYLADYRPNFLWSVGIVIVIAISTFNGLWGWRAARTLDRAVDGRS